MLLEEVAWVDFAGRKSAGRYTRAHLRVAEQNRTLCGVRIPRQIDLPQAWPFRRYFRAEPGEDTGRCGRCLSRAGEWPQ